MKLLAAAVSALALMAAPAYADCDANIITGLDVSSSIDAQETMLQIEGVADAINSPSVVSAIQNGKLGCINFMVFLWADGEYPSLVDWTVIASQEDADAVNATIKAALQDIVVGMGNASKRNWGTLTNLSGAIDHTIEALNTAPTASRVLLNIVGNGEDNVGEDPARARAAFLSLGGTINGVVVGGDPAVVAYYRAQVIGGEFARVWVANSAADVAYTYSLKFINEIAQVLP
jgi:hypothetical protein